MWFFNMVLFAVLCGSFRQRIVQAFVQKNVVFASLAARAKSSGLGAVDVGTPATAFDDGKRPFQITTPIYYVNDKPHIGHAYTSTGELLRFECDAGSRIHVPSFTLTLDIF